MRNFEKAFFFEVSRVLSVAVSGCIVLIFLAGCTPKYEGHLEEFQKYIKTRGSKQLNPSRVAAHVDPFCSVRGVKYLVHASENEGEKAGVATVALAVIYESLAVTHIDKSAKVEIRKLIEESSFFENAKYFAEQSDSSWIRSSLSRFLSRVRSKGAMSQ